MNTNDEQITAKIATIRGGPYNITLNVHQSILEQFRDKMVKSGANMEILDRCALLYNAKKLEDDETVKTIGMENGEYLDLVMKS